MAAILQLVYPVLSVSSIAFELQNIQGKQEIHATRPLPCCGVCPGIGYDWSVTAYS